MQKYVFRKYNPEYQTFFNTEKKKIAKVLGSTTTIEHVGSTAVPNLGGKAILDLAVGVSKSKLLEAKKKLEEVGYQFREKASSPERLFFRRDYPYKNRKRRVHLHLTKSNGRDWLEMIGFRDYLLKHPLAVQQYIDLKKEGVKKAQGNGEKYRKHKEKFIEQILRRIGVGKIT